MKPRTGDEEANDAVKKLLEINKTISSLDPAIRSAAFEVLVPYYFGAGPPEAPPASRRKAVAARRGGSADTADQGTFFAKFDHDQPSDNVHLIAAWLYFRHGVFSLTTQLLRSTATEVGVTIPHRPDATMRAAREKGKTLYHKRGTGYQLTVHGEAYVKQTYEVSKGRAPRPEETTE